MGTSGEPSKVLKESMRQCHLAKEIFNGLDDVSRIHFHVFTLRFVALKDTKNSDGEVKQKLDMLERLLSTKEP